MINGRSDDKNGTDIRSTDRAGIERRDLLLGGGALLAASAMTGGALVTSVPAAAQTPPEDEDDDRHPRGDNDAGQCRDAAWQIELL